MACRLWPCQAIIWTNAGILFIGPSGTNFSEILIGIQTFSFKKMHLKMSSAKWRPFCLGLNVLNSQMSLHILPSWTSYVVSIMRILGKKNNHVITTPQFILYIVYRWSHWPRSCSKRSLVWTKRWSSTLVLWTRSSQTNRNNRKKSLNLLWVHTYTMMKRQYTIKPLI